MAVFPRLRIPGPRVSTHASTTAVQPGPVNTAILAHRIRPLLSRHTARSQARCLNTNAMDAASRLLESFSGKVVTRNQLIDSNQLQRLSLTLNRKHLHPGVDVSSKPPARGTPLPPGYHLVYFTSAGVESELGVDGTDKTFNAPAPFTRRMWAGGQMQFLKGTSLKVGEEVEERTRLVGATPKKSKGGDEMVLVDVEKEFWGRDGLAVKDKRFVIGVIERKIRKKKKTDQTCSCGETHDFSDHGFSAPKSTSLWPRRPPHPGLTESRPSGPRRSRTSEARTALFFDVSDGRRSVSSGFPP